MKTDVGWALSTSLFAWWAVPTLLCGCAPYAQVQIDLLQQARKGIVQTEQSLTQKSELIAAYHDARRKQLDEAFDADVKEHQPLDSEWIIEHRKAYSAAIDVLNVARLQSELASESDRRNLAAIDLAVQRVIDLQSFQVQFFNFLQLPQGSSK